MKHCESSKKSTPHGLFGRMFPDYCHRTKEEISPESSFRWLKMGIADATGCSTANGSEWPSKDEGFSVCSLDTVLERSVPQKYYLSSVAARGFLNRAGERVGRLPKMVLLALKKAAQKRV